LSFKLTKADAGIMVLNFRNRVTEVDELMAGNYVGNIVY